MGRRILVTGARGFIGQPVVRSLVERGWSVQGASSRAARPDWPAEVEWHRAELLDPAAHAPLVAAARPEALVHLAWTMGPDWATSHDNFRWAEAGLSLLDAFAAGGGRRALVAGSGAEYAWSDMPCDEETTPLQPRTAYGSAKAALFRHATAWADRRGASLVWARIFWVYGPGERPGRLVPSVVRALAAGETARCSPGRQRRDFLFVDDAADALARLVTGDLEGPINVASGEAIAVRELALGAGRRMGAEERVDLGALPAPDEPECVVAKVARLRDELGFSPRVGLDEGLDRTVAWWRERLAGAPGSG